MKNRIYRFEFMINQMQALVTATQKQLLSLADELRNFDAQIYIEIEKERDLNRRLRDVGVKFFCETNAFGIEMIQASICHSIALERESEKIKVRIGRLAMRREKTEVTRKQTRERASKLIKSLNKLRAHRENNLLRVLDSGKGGSGLSCFASENIRQEEGLG